MYMLKADLLNLLNHDKIFILFYILIVPNNQKNSYWLDSWDIFDA